MTTTSHSRLRGMIPLRRFSIRSRKLLTGILHVFLVSALLLGFGQSVFAALNFSTSTLVTSVSGSGDIIVSDINEDNFDDLIVFGDASTSIEIFLNDQAGDFDPPIPVPIVTGNPSKGCVVDADGINGPDIVTIEGLTNSVSVYLNDGSLGFTGKSYMVGTSPSHIACADLVNANGPDIVVNVDDASNDLYVLLNDGAGDFPSIDNYNLGDLTGNAAALFGFLSPSFADLIVGTNVPSIILFDNQTDGTFNPVGDEYLLNAGQTPIAALRTADLDSVNGEDIIFLSPTNQTASIMLNNGLDTFSVPTRNYGLGSSPVALAVDDIDNVNGLDLIAVDDVDNTLSVLLNNGAGAFGGRQTFRTGEQPKGVAVLDVNNDGVQDIVTYNSADNTLSVLRNTTNFTPNSFSFKSVNNAGISTLVTSSFAFIYGIDSPSPISIDCPLLVECEYRIDKGAFTSAAGVIRNNSLVYVRVRSSVSYFSAVTATLTIGGRSATFTVTTKPDIDPNPFSFSAVKNVSAKSYITSENITITGIGVDEQPGVEAALPDTNVKAPVSISGLYSPAYSLDGGVTWRTGDGKIMNEGQVMVRVLSNSVHKGYREATLSIGDQKARFVVQTEARKAGSFYGGDGDPIFVHRKVDDDVGTKDFFLGSWMYMSLLSWLTLLLGRKRYK